MKIADALLLQKDISEEMGRLKQLAQQSSWQWSARGAGEKLEVTFDLKDNHERVVHLSKLHRRLSRAITRANNNTDLDISDEQYKEWL